ncbi:hypothetical protein SDC9_187937 [bioreactor metagenome]|uniref:Type VI secretion system baseplate subunit TssG n=1 Tax=bioreactor metagenome TaxID=1076179 RepID=A0A645HNJ6_9ZZZZ
MRQSRNPEGLEKLVAHYFATACRMQEFVLSRMPIPINEQTRLGLRGVNNQLGAGAVAGSHLPDVQSRFRLILGEMTLAQFEDFLPPCPNNRKLRDWVRDYVGIEYEWDVQLLLRADEVPSTRLGGGTRLGWTTWLGERHSTRPAGELRLNPEADARRVHQ